jgi:acyl-CoA thioester hydrolase
MSGVYSFDIEVTEKDVDRNGHVNNVVYIQWMQDAAVAHARDRGCLRETHAVGATWVVRTHQIEYLSPAFAGGQNHGAHVAFEFPTRAFGAEIQIRSRQR